MLSAWRTPIADHRYYAAVTDRKNTKRVCLSEARKILRQAHHILADSATTRSPPPDTPAVMTSK